MKYTSLLCAAVAAAALGSFAADGTRTPVVEEPFDAAPTGAMTGVFASIQTSHWTVNELDESAIIEGSITATEAVDGYTGKSLLLNTQGQELSVAAAAQDAKSEIKMKIRLVASDTAPTIDANDVHAAVYLLEEEGGSTNGLYALSWDGDLNGGEGANKWVPLTGTGFTVANGSLIALKVVMDYDDATATYSAFNLGDDPDQEVDDEDYIELAEVPMANSLNNQIHHLQNVAFKGTGSVDDLFITSIEKVATTATLTWELWVNGVQDEDFTVFTDTVEVSEFTSACVVEDPADYDVNNVGYVVNSIEIIEEGASSDQDVTIATLDPAAITSGNRWYITQTNVVLVAGKAYTAKINIGPQQAAPSTYVGPKSGAVRILCAADATAYGQGFIPLKFTSIEFVEASGNVSIVATFDATVVFDNGAATGTADFGVITTSALTGATTVLTGSVNATATGGTVTIPMPAGDALFIKGFTTAPAPAGD